jgi:hypothetical protein
LIYEAGSYNVGKPGKNPGDGRHLQDPDRKTGLKENKSMANSLMKGLAITLGGGLAVGLGIKIGQSAAPPALPVEQIDFGPVLDRIEGVENRIVVVETAMKEPGPMFIPSVQDLEDRVHAQSSEVEALRAAIQRATEIHDSRIDKLGYTVSNLEAKLPELIDQSIKPKFEELHERVQREMQETASQTLEIFADRIQSRVVEKIASIEGDLGRQSEAINDLRDYSLKTDQNLQRLLAGVENLADKINRKFDGPPEASRTSPMARTAPTTPTPPVPASGSVQALATPAIPTVPEQKPATPPASGPAPVQPATPPKPISLSPPAQTAESVKVPDFPSKIELGDTFEIRPPREPFPMPVPKSFSGPEFDELLAERPHTNGFRRAALVGGLVSVLAFGVGSFEFMHNRSVSAHSSGTSARPSIADSATDTLDARKLAEQSELLDQARSFNQKREYSKAEDIYRTILKSDPSNTEVKRLLASALFRQEKIDESVKILNSIAQDKSSAGQTETPQQ